MNELSRNLLLNKSKNIFQQNMTNTIQTSLINVYPPFIPMLNYVLQSKQFGKLIINNIIMFKVFIVN